jgi:membrane protease YdiL (CAAX protease family)
MSTFVRRYPALSLLVLAMILGVAPLGGVSAGLLPKGMTQVGARKLLARIVVWRVGVGWWAFVLLFGSVPAAAGLYVFSLFGGPAVDWNRLRPPSTIVPMMVVLIVLAGLGEEFGWRGFAMPRLQARHNALLSSLMIGTLWGLWHVPLFVTEGTTQYKWQAAAGLIPSVLCYTVFVTAWSVQYTWVFNNTNGSVLLAAVQHGAVNAWNGYIDVYRGHFGGVVAYTVVSVVISMFVVLVAGPIHLSRTRKRVALEP